MTSMKGPISSTDISAADSAMAAMRTANSRPTGTGALRISSRSERE